MAGDCHFLVYCYIVYQYLYEKTQQKCIDLLLLLTSSNAALLKIQIYLSFYLLTSLCFKKLLSIISSELHDHLSWIFLLVVIFPYSVRPVDIIYSNNITIYVLTNCFEGNIIGDFTFTFRYTMQENAVASRVLFFFINLFLKTGYFVDIFKLLPSKIFVFLHFAFLSSSYSLNLALIKSTDSCNLFMPNWPLIRFSCIVLTSAIISFIFCSTFC